MATPAADIFGRAFVRAGICGDRAPRVYLAAADKPARELLVVVEHGRVEHEDWRIRKDGTPCWAHVVITALRDDHGELRGFGEVIRD